MALVTISRELGAAGSYIALKLAEKLGCKCYDQQIIHEIAKKMGKDHEQLSDFDQSTYSRIGVFFQEALASLARGGMVFHPFGMGTIDWDSAELFASYPKNSYNDKDYYNILRQVVIDIAKEDNAVFVGRGCNLILKDYVTATHIRIVADKADRVNRLMQEQKIDTQKAELIIEKRDACAKMFIADFFDQDIENSHLYHCILNTSKIAPDDCIEFALKTLIIKKKT